MVLGAEAGGAGDRGGGGRHRTLEPRRRGDVLDAVRTTRQMRWWWWPARSSASSQRGELVGADDAVHDARLLEHDEVAVHRALRELGPVVEDLGDGERPRRGDERVEQRLHGWR